MKSSLAMNALVLGAVAATAVATPVERVVNLLKDLQEKLSQDEKVEQQAYDKYACFCEKTTSRKAEMIDEAQTDLRKLGQTILSVKGRVATLTSEIEELTSGISSNQEAQAKATALRQKENSAFMAETAEMKQAIAAMQQAITVLNEATKSAGEGESASLLQSSEQAGATVRAVIDKLPQRMGAKTEDLALLDSFLQGGAKGKFTPQSFTVQGILADMYKNFAADLETSTTDEASSNRKFEDFIHVKATELEEMQKEIAEKATEKAEGEARLADTQQIYDDTTAQKQADVAFFDTTKEACLNKHDEWTTRSSLRKEEIDGITQALDILTSDDARELFASSIKPGKETGAKDSYDTGRDITSFLQLRRGSSAGQGQGQGQGEAQAQSLMRAYAALKQPARSTHSLRLAALAVEVREAKVGHFQKVLVSIDGMITTLQDEGAADIEKRDQCKDEYLKIESKVKDVTWLIQKNDAKIDKLAKLITLRTEQKAKVEGEIRDVDAMMQELTDVRKGENQAFANAKSEDQQAIDLLMEARDALSSYYKNHSVEMGPIQGSVKGLFLAQQPEFEVSADQAPDTVFSGKGKRKNEAKGIVQILTSIIEDLDDEIKNGMKAEEEAQVEYEKQKLAAEELRKELVSKKTSLGEAIAKRGEEKTDEEEDKTTNEGDVEDETDYKKSIQNDCDFIIRTFEKRAAAREAEMNGLRGAKEYLAGAQPGEAALLEKTGLPGPAFDDTALAQTRFLGLAR